MRITRLRSFMSRDANRPRVIVAIDTDEGITGWGECYNHGPDRALPPLLDYFFRQIEGEDPRRIEYLMLKLQQQARFPPGAIGLAAFSAIDHCLWDISAKALGLPVYALLGGAVRDRVRVYARRLHRARPGRGARRRHRAERARTASPPSSSAPSAATSTRCAGARSCGAAPTTSRRCARSRPSDYEFAFDAHAKIFEPWQAIQLGNALAPYDPLFFEEPIRPEHIPAWARAEAPSSAARSPPASRSTAATSSWRC